MESSTGASIFDLHCDTLDRLALREAIKQGGVDFEDDGIPDERMRSLADNDAHIDLTRMLGATDAWCQCFACFVPDGLGTDVSWQVFTTVRDYFLQQVEEHADLIEQVRDARDIRRITGEGKCAGMFTVEGGSFLEEGKLDRLYEAADAGVKMLTLTWNGENAIGSGSDTDEGLSAFGREVIGAMESCHMVVDVSHANDRTFWDVAEVATRPFAASHSNVRAVCGHPRNLTDDQFRVIVERGGIVGLNYCHTFLRDDAADPTRDDILRHVDHMLELGGEHTVALGSDYDGCDPPSWLVPAENVVELYSLFSKEFGPELAQDICFENACRFFERNEE